MSSPLKRSFISSSFGSVMESKFSPSCANDPRNVESAYCVPLNVWPTSAGTAPGSFQSGREAQQSPRLLHGRLRRRHLRLRHLPAPIVADQSPPGSRSAARVSAPGCIPPAPDEDRPLSDEDPPRSTATWPFRISRNPEPSRPDTTLRADRRSSSEPRTARDSSCALAKSNPATSWPPQASPWPAPPRAVPPPVDTERRSMRIIGVPASTILVVIHQTLPRPCPRTRELMYVTWLLTVASSVETWFQA